MPTHHWWTLICTQVTLKRTIPASIIKKVNRVEQMKRTANQDYKMEDILSVTPGEPSNHIPQNTLLLNFFGAANEQPIVLGSITSWDRLTLTLGTDARQTYFDTCNVTNACFRHQTEVPKVVKLRSGIFNATPFSHKAAKPRDSWSSTNLGTHCDTWKAENHKV